MTSTDITRSDPDGALTAAERGQLAEFEDGVTRGLEMAARGFEIAGTSLKAIRDRRLYRETHGTFEAYVDEQWGMHRTHAYRLISAARP